MNMFQRTALALSLAGATLLVGCANSPASLNLSTTDTVMRGASPTAAVALTINPPQVRVQLNRQAAAHSSADKVVVGWAHLQPRRNQDARMRAEARAENRF